MTAILAVATPGVAFVAGDTKRVACFHPASKLHRWGPSVVFAQAGNGPELSKLIGQMSAVRPMVGETLDGLKQAFEQLRPNFYANAQAAKAQSDARVDAHGMLLVADADSGTVVGLDFGGDAPLTHDVFGVGGVATLARAAEEQKLTHWPNLDLWALASIGACIGVAVGWPIEAMITRPNGAGVSETVHRRYVDGAGAGDPVFAI